MRKTDQIDKIKFFTKNHKGTIIGKTHSVTWDSNRENFKIVKNTSTSFREAPFMNMYDANKSLVDCFDLQPTKEDMPNRTLRVFDSQLDKTSNTYKMLEHIAKNSESLPKVAAGNKIRDVHKHTFNNTAFGAVTVANFTDNWPLSSRPFHEWAQDKQLSTNELAALLSLNNISQDWSLSNDEILKNEQDSRQDVVLGTTITHLLEKLGEKLDILPEEIKLQNNLSSEHTNALAQLVCRIVGKLVSTWSVAKMRVRTSILNQYHNPDVINCLNSDLWDKDIFPLDMLKKLKQEGAGVNLGSTLGVVRNNSHNTNYKRNYDYSHAGPSFKRKKTQHTQRNNTHFKYREKGQNRKANATNNRNTNKNSEKPPFRKEKDYKKGKKWSKRGGKKSA